MIELALGVARFVFFLERDAQSKAASRDGMRDGLRPPFGSIDLFPGALNHYRRLWHDPGNTLSYRPGFPSTRLRPFTLAR